MMMSVIVELKQTILVVLYVETRTILFLFPPLSVKDNRKKLSNEHAFTLVTLTKVSLIKDFFSRDFMQA